MQQDWRIAPGTKISVIEGEDGKSKSVQIRADTQEKIDKAKMKIRDLIKSAKKRRINENTEVDTKRNK